MIMHKPLTEERAEYSCDTVLWFLSLTAGKAVEQFLDVLPGPSTCTSDRGLVSTPAVRWRSALYRPSWRSRRRSRGRTNHVVDRAEIHAVSGCTWSACSRTDLATAALSDPCSICSIHATYNIT